MNIEKLVFEISRQAKLNCEESEMLLHDIYNLRGDEWLDIVKNHCTKEIIGKFIKII